MLIKRGLPLFLALMFIIGAVGCSKAEDKTAAIVNGEKISVSEYEIALSGLKQSYQQQGADFESEQGKELVEQLEQQAFDNLVGQELLKQEAIKKGYEVTDEEINENVQQIKSQYDEAQFKKLLDENKLTEVTLKKQVAIKMKIDKYVEGEFGEIAVSDEELQSQYDLYKQQYEDLPAFDEIKGDLEQEIKSQKLQEKVYARIEELKSKSEIENLL